MKAKFFSTMLALALPAIAVQAGEKGVPPGLQKKGGLPPGQAKKQGAAAATNTAVAATPATPATPAAATPGSPSTTTPNPANPATPATPTTPNVSGNPATPGKPAVTTPTRSSAELKTAAEKRIQAVNSLSDRAPAAKAGLAAIAKETGASTAQLQNQRQEHPKIGLAGVLFANELAARTGKKPGVFYRQQADGKPWVKIAEENNVNLADVEAKLSRVEQAMRSAK